MVLFRCTQRLLKRFRIEPLIEPTRSSGVLGAWYANLLNVGSARLVLCLNQRTLLPVIIPARKGEFPAAFPEALRTMLMALGIADARIEREVEEVQKVAFARTESRVLLGAMNDFAFHASYYLGRDRRLTPVQAALQLAEMPSKPIGHDSADRVVRALLAGPGLRNP